jgi:acetolactate synthase-1/2/3 large subunit
VEAPDRPDFAEQGGRGVEHTGSRWLAEALAGAGVSHVFFVDAILRRTLIELETLGVRRVLAHAEKAAAYMADGYARAAGRPGVCLAQSVGAANLAAGLQDAFLHRSPVIALTGRKPAAFQYRNAYQEIDHDGPFSAVTKARARVETPEELPHLLRLAFREACEGTPRPVHLDLPGLQGELVETATIAEPPRIPPQHRLVPARRPPPDPDEIEAAARALAAAERPVVVAGAGAVLSGAHRALRALAEAGPVPVATSLGGRGILPTDHPLHLGVVGTYSAPPANRLVHAADLVLFVGCHTGDQPTQNWTVPPRDRPVVQIDVEARELGRSYPAALGVLADPARALEALAGSLRPRASWKAWAERVAAEVAAWRAHMAPLLASDAVPIRVERLCAELSAVLPEEAILVADTGYSGIWTGTLVELPSPAQRYLRAAGSLGWAFPAAIGAKCAAPDRPVVCFCGDGAFYYHLGELETARRLGLPLVVLVNDNSAFGQGLVNVHRLQGDRPGNPDEIVRFGPTDFAAVARAFGVEGIRVERPEAIRPALERALAASGPVVVDVVTDPWPRAPEPWIPPP